VPACGGFLLSEAREHAARDFDIGKEWVDFSSMEDCVGKLRHYLANLPKARAIAEHAHARVLREHTYEHRARTIVAAAREWKARAQSRAAPVG
jgi:spore maturation protein CgeB